MLVHEYYPKDFRVRREAESLVRQGHEVDVIALRQDGEPFRERVAGVSVLRLPVRRHRGQPLYVYLAEYVSFFLLAQGPLVSRTLCRRYNVVHVHNPPDFLVYAAAVPRLLGARVVLDVHDRVPELYSERFQGGGLVIRFLSLVERRCLRWADRVVTVHQPYADRLVDAGVPREHLTIVHNSADERMFPRIEAAAALEPGRPVRLLHHGTLMHRYGADVLVEATALLDLPASRIRVDIVGDGDLRPELERLIAAHGLADRVVLHGHRRTEDLASFIERADLGIVPNRRSSFTDGILPTKLLEYVQMGRPVIVSRTQVVETYFREESVNFVPAGDAAALAAAIRAYIADPGPFLARVPRAREDYQPISWLTQERHLQELVEGLLEAE